jgi:2,4-dienoyl-CoA reductase (NADPH2)
VSRRDPTIQEEVEGHLRSLLEPALLSSVRLASRIVMGAMEENMALADGAIARIKEVVGVPVVATGAILSPVDADEIIAKGYADFVGIARAFLADPDWAYKAAHDSVNDIRPCIRCNQCSDRVEANKEVRCAVNARLGREGQALAHSSRSKRVVVVGGGPGGCEAALTAGQRGHRVVLFEEHETLGGASVPAANPEFKKELEYLPRWYLRQLEDIGVDVRLGTCATADSIRILAPEAVICATGGDAVFPGVPIQSSRMALPVTPAFRS